MTPFAHSLAGSLLRGTLEATVVLALVLLLCRVLPSLLPEARGTVAWLGALKVLVACAGLAPLALPVLPASSPEPIEPLPIVVPELIAAPMIASPAPASVSTPARFADQLPAALLALWALGVCVAAGRLAQRMWRTHALVSDAVPNDDPALAALLHSLRQRAGVKREIALRLSIDAPAPFVAGAFRPTIVLPLQSLDAQTESALAMALAHEVAHVRRQDLWLGWIPALAKTVLWFHPFAHLAAREYLQAREEACDAEAVRRTSAEPADYGQLLLSFGVVRDSDASATAHGASPAFRHLHRRLRMLENVHRPRSRVQKWGAVVALGACAALLPLGVGHAERNPAGLVGQATTALIFPEDRLPNFRPLAGSPYTWTDSDDADALRELAARMPGAHEEPTSGTVTPPGPVPGTAPAAKPTPHPHVQVQIQAVPKVRSAPLPAAKPTAPALPTPAVVPAIPARAATPVPAPVVNPPDEDSDSECPKERARRRLQAQISAQVETALREALPEELLQDLHSEGIRIDARLTRAMSRFAARTASLSRREAALELQRAAIDRAEQELAAQQSEQETRRAQLEQKRSELEADEDACPDQVRDLERAMRRLERAISAIERSRDTLERDRDRYEEKRAQLEEKQQSLEEMLENTLELVDQS